MPFTTPLAIAIYLTIWWIVLFAVLPLGVRQQDEDDRPAGGDPGAPAAPRLLIKAVITTGVATVLFAALLAFMKLSG